MRPNSTTLNFNSWWGRHTIEPNRQDLWQLGPLRVWIQHLTHQWQVSWKHDGNWLDSKTRIVLGSNQEPPPPTAKHVHCVFGSSTRQDLIFTPALPDRPIVTRLETPLEVLPGELVTLYVISPLRLRVEMAAVQSGPEAAPQKLLQEIPTFRLSDTWFGPMSSQGELCYASTVPAFLDLAQVPMRLHCAISAVSIRNSADTSLRLDRINVPLPRLSLFYSSRTGFWTDAFAIERKEDSEMASLRLHGQPPLEAAPTQFVSGPRHAGSASENLGIRAFSALFRDRNSM